MGECLIMRRGGETYKPAILNTAYPQDVTKTVIKGNTTSATFNVLIAEAGTPAEYTYQWYKDGVAVSGATSSSYTISGLGSTVTHTVYCEVTNKGGTVQSRIATLKVTQQYTPTLNSSYPADVTGLEIGKSATFKVEIATEGNPATYTYQWYVNGSAVSGATDASYTRSNLAKGSYTVYCKVTNAVGTVQSRTATLTVTKKYIFKSGTGVMVPVAAKGNDYHGTVSVGTNSIDLNYGTAEWDGSAGVMLGSVSLTGFNKLCFDMQIVRVISTSGYVRTFGAYSNSGDLGETATSYASAVTTPTATSSRKTYTVDISKLSGNYYVGSKGIGQANIYNIWIE